MRSSYGNYTGYGNYNWRGAPNNNGRFNRQNQRRPSPYQNPHNERGFRGARSSFNYRGQRGHKNRLVTPNEYHQNYQQNNQNFAGSFNSGRDEYASNNLNSGNRANQMFEQESNSISTYNSESIQPPSYDSAVVNSNSSDNQTSNNYEYKPVFNWHRINDFVPGELQNNRLTFTLNTDNGTDVAYKGQRGNFNGEIILLDNKLYEVQTVEIEFRYLIPLLEKIDIKPDDILLNNAGPGTLHRTTIRKNN